MQESMQENSCFLCFTMFTDAWWTCLVKRIDFKLMWYLYWRVCLCVKQCNVFTPPQARNNRFAGVVNNSFSIDEQDELDAEVVQSYLPLVDESGDGFWGAFKMGHVFFIALFLLLLKGYGLVCLSTWELCLCASLIWFVGDGIVWRSHWFHAIVQQIYIHYYFCNCRVKSTSMSPVLFTIALWDRMNWMRTKAVIFSHT